MSDQAELSDDQLGRLPVPVWYRLVALAGLLFEIAGVYAFILQMTVDPRSLPIDQRALAETLPTLTLVAYGMAVTSGLAGAVALLARWPWASAALLLSLIAMAVQFASTLLGTTARGTTPSADLLGPILILLCAYGLWQFAKIARRRGWLD